MVISSSRSRKVMLRHWQPCRFRLMRSWFTWMSTRMERPFDSFETLQLFCVTWDSSRKNLSEAHSICFRSNRSGWWFQPLWKIWVNGKDYPIYYGKYKMFETNNHLWYFNSNLIPTSRLWYPPYLRFQDVTRNSVEHLAKNWNTPRCVSKCVHPKLLLQRSIRKKETSCFETILTLRETIFGKSCCQWNHMKSKPFKSGEPYSDPYTIHT